MRGRIAILIVIALAASCESSDFTGDSTGQGGSMARFAISGNYMYVVSSGTLGVYGITAGDFTHIRNIDLERGLETITTKGAFVYLGSSDAMYIFSIADPENPQFLFRYAHIRSCDPVVVQDNRAYVTLRGGGRCGGVENVLEIIDITNPTDPTLITSYPMQSPGGLGISGHCLFVCEGAAGLKMLNVTDDKVEELTRLTNVHAYDVIVQPATITLTGEDGVFQYTFDCASAAINLVSKIPVIRAEQ